MSLPLNQVALVSDQNPDPGAWEGWDDFEPVYERARPHTLVSQDRCWVLYSLAKIALQMPGNLYEAGVFRGGTAIILRHIVSNAPIGSSQKTLRLFDTFGGMPKTDPERDLHQSGDFDNTDVETVKHNVGNDAWIAYHQGFIPDTFFRA